jgi:competence protein ComEC
MASMTRAYDVRRRGRRHPLTEREVVLLTVAAVVGVWTRSAPWTGASAIVCWLVARRPAVLVGCLILGVIGGWRSQVDWADAVPRQLGQFTGWATVVGDPAPFGRGLRVTLEVDGQRFDAWTYGSPRRRLIDRQAGDRVFVQGHRRLITSNGRRAQIRHVVGNIDISFVGDWLDGSPLYRTSSRVRSKLRRVAESTIGGDNAALFTGLVIGDDAREPVGMVGAFRASGLSHLTAVSGENVAFVLAAASPLLRRLRPWWRWAATVGLIGWFMMLTRFEPSVLRAGVMAMLGSSAFVLGRQQSAVRLLACTVTILVLADPMLVWSVGFWLSTGATAGVCVVAPKLAGWLPGPQWLRVPTSVTLGAQAGVALPSWLVFNRLPLVSLPANLLAVPVAGFVMLFGIPAGLLSALVPPLAPLLMAPCAMGTRWVATVAYLGAAAEPSEGWSTAGWLFVVGTVVAMLVRHRWRRPPEVVPI